MLVGQNGRNPGIEDMVSVANQVSIPEGNTRNIIKKVRDIVSDWKKYAQQANVDASIMRDIDKAINSGNTTNGPSRAAFLGWQSGQGR